MGAGEESGGGQRGLTFRPPKPGDAPPHRVQAGRTSQALTFCLHFALKLTLVEHLGASFCY